MNILLIHQAFAAIGEPGGTRHHEFARQLQRKGHHVTVITGQVSYLTGRVMEGSGWILKEVDDVGVEIWRCRSYSGWHRSFLHRMASFLTFMLTSFLAGLRVPDVDLVWGTSPPIFQAVTAWLTARLKRTPFLLEVRDLWPYFAVAAGVLHQPVLIRLSEWLERFLYLRADSIVVNSPGFLDHVRTRGGEDVSVVPNGVDVAMFKESMEKDVSHSENHHKDVFVVLYAGAHGVSNDLDTVLAAADLLNATKGVQFVLLGDGKEKRRLQAKADRMGLINIQFMSAVPKSNIPQALNKADACLAILMPIEAYKTTYPNKVFDYMAAGKPILLMIDGVIREVVEQADAGTFVQPGDARALADAIQSLERDPRRCESMGQNGRRFVEKHFDRVHLADEMEKSILAMVNQPSEEPGSRMKDSA